MTPSPDFGDLPQWDPAQPDARNDPAASHWEEDIGSDLQDVLLTTTDARVWAMGFCDQLGNRAPDEVMMISWFAAALATGRSAGRHEP